jgi:hypothetical protein
MGYTFLGSVTAISSDGNSVVTANVTSFAAADLIVVCVGRYAPGTVTTGLTDSLSNAYGSSLGALTNNTAVLEIFYKKNPTVSGSMTFSFGTNTAYPAMVVMGFSGSASSPLDQNAAGGTPGNGAVTVQPGSITPTEVNELLIAAMAGEAVTSGTTTTINEGFNAVFNASNGALSVYCGASYLIQTSIVSKYPTFTIS